MTGDAASTRAKWWWSAVVVTATMALIGLTEPAAALPVLLVTTIILAGLALIAAASAITRQVRPAPRSEFAPRLYQRPVDELPTHISRIVPDGPPGTAALTAGARANLVTVVTERLWARHGLNLQAPDDHARIQSLLTPRLWDAVRPSAPVAHPHPGRRLDVPRRMRHAELDGLLDDLDDL